MNTLVELRMMQVEDVPRVMEIEKDCFPTPWRESAYLTELSNRSAYYQVACVGDVVVGYVGMWVIADEAHITTLGVARNWRQRRIGEQLLIGVLDEARKRGARRATLEVRRGNSAAQNLYRKYGFAAAAIRKGYYTDNHEDAVVMWIDDMTTPPFVAQYGTLKRELSSQLRHAPAGEVA